MIFASVRSPRALRGPGAALAAALALVLAIALPAAAAGPIKLAEPSVSARSVTSGASIVFRVTYRNQTGEAARLIGVRLDDQLYPMGPASDPTSIRTGVRYEAKVRPRVGSAKVTYEATDEKGRHTELSGGTIEVVKAASPGGGGAAPTPQPAPTAGPIVAPTSSGTAPQAPSTTSAGATTTIPSAVFLVRIDGGAGAPAGDEAPSPAWLTAAGLGWLAPALRAEAVPGSDDPAGSAALGATDGTSDRSSSRSTGPAAAIVPSSPAALVTPRWTPAQAAATVAVTTFGGTAMAMAFLLFGKRRRDGEPTADDETLGVAAATSAMAPAVAAVLGPDVMPAPTLPHEAELAVPRWRRASLLEARKADPIRAPLGPVVSLTFEHGTVAALDGYEIRTIRYRVVRLLDQPDELVAQEVGVLDQGDEVQLLERSGPYWLVLAPDGRRGWLHRMTLGDAPLPTSATPTARAHGTSTWDDPYGGRLASVGGGAASGAPGTTVTRVQGDAAVATGLPAGEGPGGDDVDADVLEAYLRSIGRG